MNITEELIKRLGLIGYPWKESTILKYFLDENVKTIFGTNTISYSDIDLMVSDNFIDIECTFSESRRRIIVDKSPDNMFAKIVCIKIDQDNDVAKLTVEFDITESSDSIENEYCDGSGVKKSYTFDKTTKDFGLEISHIENENRVLDYKASLSPTGDKIRDLDCFTYTREYPPKEDEKSFLKRLVDELSGRGDSRQIATSTESSIGVEEFPNTIFECLTRDAEIVLASKEQSNKGNKRKVRI